MDALGAFSMWRMQEVLFRMSLKSEPTSTVRDLDQGHVIPNMAPPNWRGIWYPKGFDTDIRDERSSARPGDSASARSPRSQSDLPLITIFRYGIDGHAGRPG
jgi:hypothetical protein